MKRGIVGFALGLMVAFVWIGLTRHAADSARDSVNSDWSGKGASYYGRRSEGAPQEAANAPPPSAAGDVTVDRFAKANTSSPRQSDARHEVNAEATRSWFPETFLFEPLVVTDSSGRADVSVTVPDRLTNWRVLALAHSRDGAQAGTVTSFSGTLPVYVDPVVPSFAYAGDEIRVPLQLVNTTNAEVSVTLDVHAVGAHLSGVNPIAKLPPGASVVEYASLQAEHTGTVTLLVRLEGHDAISRTFPVLPFGRAIQQERRGSLAATRELRIALPGDIAAAGAGARLEVFPGALALLRSELAESAARNDQEAYSLLLAGQGPGLLSQLGEAPDKTALRSLRIVATQRVLRKAGQVSDPAEMAALLEAAAANGDDEVLSRTVRWLGDRLAATQRPDGSFSGGNGWTLQRLLVTSAECVRVLRSVQKSDSEKRRAASAALRAQGFFERQLGFVKDGYTAAALVGSGVLPTAAADRLRKRVRDALSASSVEGGKTLTVSDGLTRADGHEPTETDRAAMAVLALDPKNDAQARADLGTTVLAAYSPGIGWGDAPTDIIALRAILELFEEPLPRNVLVQLLMDGHPEAQATLDSQRAREVVALDAHPSTVAGDHRWTVKAEPPVPGLGFHLTVTGYGPWKTGQSNGLELQTETPETLQLGEPVDVSFSADQAGRSVRIHQPLPAGMQVHRPSLDALVAAGTINSYEVSDRAVDLILPTGASGTSVSARWRAIPTLAGILHSPAPEIVVSNGGDETAYASPAVWHVKSGAR